jgi:hypothetical protein
MQLVANFWIGSVVVGTSVFYLLGCLTTLKKKGLGVTKVFATLWGAFIAVAYLMFWPIPVIPSLFVGWFPLAWLLGFVGAMLVVAIGIIPELD